jgi:anti-anti-sigma regulatory factor
MFRIEKIFQNEKTVIFSVQGYITDRFLDDWKEQLTTIKNKSTAEVILNFHGVSFVSPSALTALRAVDTSNVFIMNCSPVIRNMIQSVGISSILLG